LRRTPVVQVKRKMGELREANQKIRALRFLRGFRVKDFSTLRKPLVACSNLLRIADHRGYNFAHST